MLDDIANHLTILVGCDTTNPPRAIGVDHPALSYARGVLEGCGFTTMTRDLGGGSVNLHAMRGGAATLVNCHLDTVPPDSGWNRDPFDLLVEDGRAIGLGACDIKGSAACILAAAQRTSGDAAVLLTTDEEAGTSACVRAFIDEPAGAYTGVIVSEPTSGRAVLEHRGIVSAQVEFKGQGGHASRGGSRSALHDAVLWGAGALGAAANAEASGEAWRLNIGRVEGGTKPNMVASSASVRFGIRPSAGHDADAIMGAIKDAAPTDALATWTTRFTAPALRETNASRALASSLGLEIAPGVDFWTEAALFARAGLPTLVLGPGDIAQAHSAGEYVPLKDLERVTGVFTRLFSDGAGEH